MWRSALSFIQVTYPPNNDKSIQLKKNDLTVLAGHDPTRPEMAPSRKTPYNIFFELYAFITLTSTLVLGIH